MSEIKQGSCSVMCNSRKYMYINFRIGNEQNDVYLKRVMCFPWQKVINKKKKKKWNQHQKQMLSCRVFFCFLFFFCYLGPFFLICSAVAKIYKENTREIIIYFYFLEKSCIFTYIELTCNYISFYYVDIVQNCCTHLFIPPPISILSLLHTFL